MCTKHIHTYTNTIYIGPSVAFYTYTRIHMNTAIKHTHSCLVRPRHTVVAMKRLETTLAFSWNPRLFTTMHTVVYLSIQRLATQTVAI